MRTAPINIRRTGLVVAIGVGLMCVGLTLFMLARGGGSKPRGIPPIAAGENPPMPKDITEAGMKGAGRGTVQYVDRNDPTRVAGTIQWSAIDPQSNGSSNVKGPRASIFLKDGRTLVVESPRGKLFTPPKGAQPESGYFEGGVLIALFEPKADGSVNIQADSPVVLFHTLTLTFDLALGELASADAFALSAKTFEMRGQEFRILINQVADRIERFDVKKTEYVRVVPNGSGGSAGDAARAQPPAASVAAAAPTGHGLNIKPTDKVTIYQSTFGGDVRLTQLKRTLSADTLNVWMRLVNNSLPEGSLPRGGGAAGATSPSIATAPAARTEATSTLEAPSTAPIVRGMPKASLEAPPSLCPTSPDEVRMTWTGAMQMVPVLVDPPELDRDHVLARFASPRTGEVRIADEALGFTGRAPTLDVGLTSQDITLSGGAPDEVSLRLNNRGELRAGRVSINTAAGVAVVRGPGTLSTLSAPLAAAPAPATGPGEAATKPAKVLPPRTISWNDQADFTFATENGRATDRLTLAQFAGKVEARDQRAMLAASVLGAEFGARTARGAVDPAKASSGNVTLTAIRAQDAEVTTADKQSLKSRELAVYFQEPLTGSDPEPTLLTAGGSLGEQIEARDSRFALTCDRLEADLRRDERGDIVATKVLGRGDVTFLDHRKESKVAGGPALLINADQINAYPTDNRVDLIGGQVSITSGGSTILGTQMAIDGDKRELLVHGPGVFMMKDKPAGRGHGSLGVAAAIPDHSPRLVAAWNNSMLVSDIKGTAECRGDARAIATARDDDIDWLNAERILLTFTPGSGDAATTTLSSSAVPTLTMGATASSAPEITRKLLKLEAFGHALEKGDGARASIESRHFTQPLPPAGSTDGPPRELQRLLYLEGDRIIAGVDDATLTVPGAGRLLVDQREPTRPAAAPEASAIETGVMASRQQQDQLIDLNKGGVGTSLFNWTGSLQLNRSANLFTINDSVRLIHRASPSQPVVTLECNTIQGILRDTLSATNSDNAFGDSAALRQAIASGNVYVHTDDNKQLVAETITFDADRSTLEASGGSESRVSFVDPAKPAPITAQRLMWYLHDGRVEVSAPSATITPP